MNGKAILRSAVVSLALAAAACINGQAQTLVRDGVEVSPGAYDFGEVDGGVEILYGKFVLRNCGADSLRLEDVVPGCHCTKVTWSREAVASGESCEIAFEYHLDKYTTSIRKDIKVMTSRSEEPLTLNIYGTVVESEESLAQKYPYMHGVLGMEEETVKLGKVYRGEAKSDIVKLVNRSGETVNVEVGECSPGLGAKMVKTTVYSQGEGFLRVSLESGEEWGWHEYSVTPVVNGEAVEPIRLTALTVPDFRKADSKQRNEGPYPLVRSSSVRVETSRGQKSTSVEVKLENIGKETLEVLSARIPEKCFKVDFPGRVAANSSSSLRITLDASGLSRGEYSTTLYLVTNSAAACVCEVKVRYVVR